MNYTPGPWFTEATSKIGHFAIRDSDGFTICKPSPMGADNARLIAAAPDLLAAVHGLLASCGPQHESETAEMYRERTALLQWHIDRASEALIKAIGE